MENIISLLGPLAPLVGVWEGDKGDDVAPSDDRGIENNKYRERMTFLPFGPTNNHEQCLYGLRYTTTAWRIGEADPFHEDMGYWLWDAKDKQVMKAFVIPRGIAIMAGGTVAPTSKSFTISAKDGSCTYGLVHNIFLEKEFKMMGFELSISILDDKTFSYKQDTQLKLRDRQSIFHHTDANTLKLVNREVRALGERH